MNPNEDRTPLDDAYEQCQAERDALLRENKQMRSECDACDSAIDQHLTRVRRLEEALRLAVGFVDDYLELGVTRIKPEGRYDPYEEASDACDPSTAAMRPDEIETEAEALQWHELAERWPELRPTRPSGSYLRRMDDGKWWWQATTLFVPCWKETAHALHRDRAVEVLGKHGTRSCERGLKDGSIEWGYVLPSGKACRSTDRDLALRMACEAVLKETTSCDD